MVGTIHFQVHVGSHQDFPFFGMPAASRAIELRSEYILDDISQALEEWDDVMWVHGDLESSSMMISLSCAVRHFVTSAFHSEGNSLHL